MRENLLIDKCPICREKNWIQFKNNKILPIKSDLEEIKVDDIKEEINANSSINFLNNCSINNFLAILIYIKKCFYNLYIIILSITLSYACGFFTIYIFNPGIDLRSNYSLYWLPFLVSLCWLIIILSPCCCGKILTETYCIRFQ